MLDSVLTVATWIGFAVLGIVLLFVVAMVVSFISTIFDADKQDSFDFYKGDLDDD